MNSVRLTVQHTDLGTAVTAALRSAIVSGELAAGERLVEADLAEQFGVSRGPVRDALAELQRSGLVELRARKGSFVRSLSAVDVDEIYSLRIALESLAVRRAVGPDGRSAGLADRLNGLLDDLRLANAGGDPVEIGAADMALHRGLVEAGGHGRLLEAWDRLADQTLLMMTDLPALAPEIQGPMGAHSDIVEQIAANDANAAVDALVEHLSAARQAILDRFNR